MNPIRAHLERQARALAGDPRRDLTLAVLRRYARAERYPRPSAPVVPRPGPRPAGAFTGPGSRMPIFRDARGTWCAVGAMVAATSPALAARLAATRNDAWLLELDDPELAAWAARHGYTPTELARIQPTYCWEVPVCEDLAAWIADPWDLDTPVTPCGDVDVPMDAQQVRFCQDCAAPAEIWVTLVNRGAADVPVLSLRASAGAVVLDALVGSLPAGHQGVFGPLRMPTADRPVGVDVTLSVPGNCSPFTAVALWGGGYPGPGWVAAEACGGGCSQDSGAPQVTEPQPRSEPSSACDATGAGGTTGALLLAALHGIRRRGRAR